jgi:hypothetical protein
MTTDSKIEICKHVQLQPGKLQNYQKQRFLLPEIWAVSGEGSDVFRPLFFNIDKMKDLIGGYYSA